MAPRLQSDGTRQRVDLEGVPCTLATSAETRGRRLYLDGEVFPYATSSDYDLKVIRAHGLTVVMVPVVVDGPVTITPKLHSSAQTGGATDLPTVACDEDGMPISVWVDGSWRKLANEREG